MLTILGSEYHSFIETPPVFLMSPPVFFHLQNLRQYFVNERFPFLKTKTVTTIFWAKVLCSLAAEDACFRMRVILGVVFIRSLVFHLCVPECSRNGSGMRRSCWFKRNSSNLERAPKMRDSVLLNSWDSFLVTLPSICSETCVIYSSLILGTDVFRDWPFLGFSSCVSLVTAANFRLFLNVAIFLKGKGSAVRKTELFCIC